MGCPVPASQRISSPSDPADASRAPSGWKATARTRWAAVRVRIHCPVAASQIRIVRSQLAEATRRASEVRLGASPRATLQLLRAAKAWAALTGREYVIPDDLQYLLSPVLGHRLLLTAEAHVSGRTTADLLGRIAHSTPIPSAAGHGSR